MSLFDSYDAERKAVLLERIQAWPAPVLMITHHADELKRAKKTIGLGLKNS